MTTMRIGLLLAALITTPLPATAQNRSTFHATVGPVTIDVESSGPSNVLLTYPDGRATLLDKRLLFPVGDASAFGDSRLILLSQPHHNGAAIVDIPTATIVDQLSLGTAAVSPTGQFIAYNAFVPRWADAGALYLVYDVSQPAGANRLPKGRRQGTVHKSYDHGWPVYPPENVAGRTYQTPTYAIRGEAAAWSSTNVTRPMHRRASALTWIGDTQLAFVDECSGVYTLVIADVAGGATRPVVTTRPLDAGHDSRVEIESLTRLPDRNGVMVVQLKLKTQFSSLVTEVLVR